MNQFDPLTNEMLIMRLKKNMMDEQAFLLLVQRFVPMLKKFAYYMPVDGYDPNDMVQEGILFLYRVIDFYNPLYGGYFAPYFERAFHNYLINLLKKTTADAQTIRFGISSEEEQQSIGESLTHQSITHASAFRENPESQVIVREDFERYVSVLSPLEREVIYCYTKLNMMPREIEQHLQLEGKTVKYALRRARDKLKNLLNDQK